MKNKGIIIGIATILCVLLAVFSIPQLSRNKAIAYEQAVITAKADVSVQEKARIDKVYNLADCVKQYDAHESETLTELAENMKAGSVSDSEISTAISAVTYAYPELKSQANYQTLMLELTTIENNISNARQSYNFTVSKYNSYVQKFPTNTLLGITGYQIKDFSQYDFGDIEDAPTNLFE